MNSGNIMLLVLAGVFAILLIFSYTRRKNYQGQIQEMRDSVKKGDKVMTDSGVVGTVVDSLIDEDGAKYHILKTGRNEFTSFVQVHANSVYYVYGKNGPVSPATEKIADVKKDETNEKTTKKEKAKLNKKN